MSDINKTSCLLTWDEPDSDGGSEVTGYYVEKLSRSKWVKVNKKAISDCEYKVTDLVEKSKDNEFRVCAENLAGIGAPSETTGKFVAKNPYDPPSKPDAPVVEEMLEDSASVTWKPPASDGGSPITNYILEMKASNEVKWVAVSKDIPDLKYNVTELKAEKSYEFRVSAQNKAGPGPASPPSKPAKYGKPFDHKLLSNCMDRLQASMAERLTTFPLDGQGHSNLCVTFSIL